MSRPLSRSVALMSLLATLSLGGCRKPPPPATKSAVDVSSPPSANFTDGGVAVSPAPAAAVAPAVAAAARPKPAKIRVVVRSSPPKAWVTWGKKKLGPTPVIVERPRESGPMDLVVRADGYFPVHARAYTFHNDTLYVKLTRLSDKMTLFGAKQEVVEPSPSPAPPPL